MPWAYEVLAEVGLTYDASLLPYTTFLYGDSRAPVAPFAHSAHSAHGRKLIAVPATVLLLAGQRLPYSCGFYLRILPYWAIRMAMRLTNRQGRPVEFYLHPREIDPAQPWLPLPLRDYFITYMNLSGTLAKLERILAIAPAVSIHRILAASGLIDGVRPSSIPSPGRPGRGHAAARPDAGRGRQ